MYTNSRIEQLKEDFAISQSKRRKKLKKVWGILLLITILLCVFFIVLFPNQFNNGDTAWILPTYGGLSVLTFLIGYLISMGFRSEKPYYEYLYPEIIENINLEQGLFLEYTSYPPNDKEFNKRGGMFPPYSMPNIRRLMKGYTEDQLSYLVYDVSLTTSNGKSQTTHFDGVYIILEKSVSTELQVRSNGNPRNKNEKLERIQEIEKIRTFKPTGIQLTGNDHGYIEFAYNLKNDNRYKRVYLSVVNGEIHLALWLNRLVLREKRDITQEFLQEITNHFLLEMNLIETMEKIDSF